jgi:hypothetical protein
MARDGAWTSKDAEVEAGATPAPTPTPLPLPQFAPNLRVLIADDQPTNRRLLRRAFTSFFGPSPWAISEAATAEQAPQSLTPTPTPAPTPTTP